jgi:hypothetical protein
MPTVTLENVRISYPTLFTPKQVAGQGEPKYSAAFIIDNNNPGLKKLLALRDEVVKTAYPTGKIPSGFKGLPLYAGEDKHPGNEDYAGCHLLNSSNKNKPVVVDQQMNKVLDPAQVYPGMFVNVAVSVYCYNQTLSKGVTCGLEAVQLVRDGERLDNRPNVNELFSPIAVPGEAGGLFG